MLSGGLNKFEVPWLLSNGAGPSVERAETNSSVVVLNFGIRLTRAGLHGSGRHNCFLSFEP